jgi:hypothetical protein
METTILELLKTVGLPILLVLYYLFIERPKQIIAAHEDNARYDGLVQTIVKCNEECATQLKQLITAHTDDIKTLISNIPSNKK